MIQISHYPSPVLTQLSYTHARYSSKSNSNRYKASYHPYKYLASKQHILTSHNIQYIYYPTYYITLIFHYITNFFVKCSWSLEVASSSSNTPIFGK